MVVFERGDEFEVLESHLFLYDVEFFGEWVDFEVHFNRGESLVILNVWEDWFNVELLDVDGFFVSGFAIRQDLLVRGVEEGVFNLLVHN